jgi:hypothetical protein
MHCHHSMGCRAPAIWCLRPGFAALFQMQGWHVCASLLTVTSLSDGLHHSLAVRGLGPDQRCCTVTSQPAAVSSALSSTARKARHPAHCTSAQSCDAVQTGPSQTRRCSCFVPRPPMASPAAKAAIARCCPLQIFVRYLLTRFRME